MQGSGTRLQADAQVAAVVGRKEVRDVRGEGGSDDQQEGEDEGREGREQLEQISHAELDGGVREQIKFSSGGESHTRASYHIKVTDLDARQALVSRQTEHQVVQQFM